MTPREKLRELLNRRLEEEKQADRILTTRRELLARSRAERTAEAAISELPRGRLAVREDQDKSRHIPAKLSEPEDATPRRKEEPVEDRRSSILPKTTLPSPVGKQEERHTSRIEREKHSRAPEINQSPRPSATAKTRVRNNRPNRETSAARPGTPIPSRKQDRIEEGSRLHKLPSSPHSPKSPEPKPERQFAANARAPAKPARPAPVREPDEEVRSAKPVAPKTPPTLPRPSNQKNPKEPGPHRPLRTATTSLETELSSARKQPSKTDGDISRHDVLSPKRTTAHEVQPLPRRSSTPKPDLSALALARAPQRAATAPARAHPASTRHTQPADAAAPLSTPLQTGPGSELPFRDVATPVGLYPLPLTPLPQLNTKGASIIGPESSAIALRGVNVVGFDGLTSIQTATSDLDLDATNLAVLQQLWSVNVVRISFQPQTISAGNGTLTAIDVMAALDSIVNALTSVGIYTLLACAAPSQAATPPAPGANIAPALQALAAHYSSNPGVLYELFATAAPLDPSWLQSAPVLIGAIRSHNPAALIFVNTGNGGIDISQLPLVFPTGAIIFNLVYTIAVSGESPPDPDGSLLNSLAQQCPVCATIWAKANTGVPDFVAELFGRYGIHWIASNWNADPLLVTDPAHYEFSPTDWGTTVMRAAAYPVKPFLQPFPTPGNTTP